MSHAETAHHNALTLPYPPSSNRYWRHARGRTYISAEARAYRAAVARIAPVLPLDGPVSVTLTVYRPRKAGDLDNTFKVLLDALNGLAWHDDSQIVELHGYRHEDKENPRVEVEVKRLSVPTRGTYGKVPPGAKRTGQRAETPGSKRVKACGCLRNLGRCEHSAPYSPPRSVGLDASTLAAETFAPPAACNWGHTDCCLEHPAESPRMDAPCSCTREQPCSACSRVGL